LAEVFVGPLQLPKGHVHAHLGLDERPVLVPQLLLDVLVSLIRLVVVMLKRSHDLLSLVSNKTLLEDLEVEHIVVLVVQGSGTVREGFEHQTDVDLVLV
jgi:hypothetical protein